MNWKRSSGLLAHEPLDEIGGLARGVLGEHDAEQRAAAELHGGLLELGGQHLAEPLEAAHLDFAARLELALDQRLAMLLVAGVERLAALRQPVERRQREKEMPARG